MKLKKFKEKNNKMIGVVLFTIICILLIGSVILYKTFASFEVNHNFNIINGSIQEVGNVYFAFYENGKIVSTMPQKGSEYVLDETESYCVVNGEVALIYPSDYGYATSGGNGKTRNDCLNQDIYHWINSGFEDCYNKNWLFPNNMSPWTLSHVTNESVNQAIRIFGDGGIKASSNITQSQDVFPTIYLKSNVKIVNDQNDGSINSPYHLQQIL